MRCTLEATLSNKELFLEFNCLSRENTLFHDFDKFPCTLSAIVVNDSSEHKKVHVNELTALRSNWLIGYYALGVINKQRAKVSGMCDIPNSSYSAKGFTENYSV